MFFNKKKKLPTKKEIGSFYKLPFHEMPFNEIEIDTKNKKILLNDEEIRQTCSVSFKSSTFDSPTVNLSFECGVVLAGYIVSNQFKFEPIVCGACGELVGSLRRDCKTYSVTCPKCSCTKITTEFQ